MGSEKNVMDPNEVAHRQYTQWREGQAEAERKAEWDALVSEVDSLHKECDELREANKELQEAIANMITGDARPLPNGCKSPVEQLVEQMEALREDNARLIRAVCALAEREVKRSEVGDE